LDNIQSYDSNDAWQLGRTEISFKGQ
jgi:hypothetical protein